MKKTIGNWISRYFKISRIRIVLMVLLTIATCAVCFLVVKPVFHAEKKTAGGVGEVSTITSGINDNNVLYQSFFIKQKAKLNRVTFKVATYQNTVSMPFINVSITTKRNGVLASVDIPVTELIDNQDYTVNFDGVELDGWSRYYLKISGARPNGDADVSPSFYLTELNDSNGFLYVGETIVDGMALYALFDYETVPQDWHLFLYVFFVFLFWLIACCLPKEKMKYIPVMVLVLVCAFLFQDICSRTDWANATFYNLELVRRYCLWGTIGIVLICVILSVFKNKGMIDKAEEIYRRTCERYKFVKWIQGIVGVIFVCLLFGVQYKIAYVLYQKIGWDVSYCFEGAWQLVHDGAIKDSYYLNVYPNNKGLTFVMYWMIKLFQDQTEAQIYWKLVLMNLLSLDLAMVLLYNVAKNILGKASARISVILCALLIGLSGWIIVPYTDTLTIWIPLLILNLFLCYKKLDTLQSSIEKKSRMKFLFLFLEGMCIVCMGVLTIWGYHMKPQCVIVTIAIVLCTVPVILWRRQWSKMGVVLLLFFGLAAGELSFSVATEPYFEAQTDTSNSMPMTHFLMMGLNENPTTVCFGGFDYASTSYSSQYGSTEEKKEANLIRIRQELNHYGIKGCLRHIWDKAQMILSDGTFFWQTEGSFYLTDYSLQEGNEAQQKIRELYYGSAGGYDNTRHMQFMSKLTGLWYIVLLFAIIPVSRAKKQEQGGVKLWIVVFSALGCIAFTLLFEGRSRYLINYIPFFCMLAGAGMVGVYRWIYAMSHFFAYQISARKGKDETWV